MCGVEQERLVRLDHPGMRLGLIDWTFINETMSCCSSLISAKKERRQIGWEWSSSDASFHKFTQSTTFEDNCENRAKNKKQKTNSVFNSIPIVFLLRRSPSVHLVCSFAQWGRNTPGMKFAIKGLSYKGPADQLLAISEITTF